MKPRHAATLVVLLASCLLLLGASRNARPDQHREGSQEQTNVTEQRQPESTVPLSLYNSTQSALGSALHALQAEQEARAKEKRPEYEPWCSPSVIVQAVLAVVGAGYLIFAALQWQVVYLAFFADHRPRLGIRRIALLNVPEEILVQSSEGALTQPAPIEVQLQLINRGGSDAQIIEGNVTLKVDKFESISEALKKKKVLPPFDVRKGTPAYSEERDAAEGAIVKPAEPFSFNKMMPVSGSPGDAVFIYLAVHHGEDSSTVAFHVFGYFKYRTTAWFQRSYFTAFCRRYDPEKGGFVAINEPDYEYED
ncbi:MAG: hypothetical protein ACLPQ0_00525 [Candidatus Binatus sp.]